MGYYPLNSHFIPEPEAPTPVVAEKPEFPPGATFVAAEAFAGAQPGFVFKAGDEGTGYYFDEIQANSIAEEAAAPVDVSEKARSLLDEVREAGGNVARLAALAHGSRTELTSALKELGFKGLRTRQRIEEELKEWKPG